MLRRGNRDTLLTDRINYEKAIRRYDHVEESKDIKEGEEVIIFLILSTCTILILGSILSIIASLRGI